MKKTPFIVFACMLIAASDCIGQIKKQTAINQIIEAELRFNQMASTQGIQKAFEFYAADDVIIKRGNDSLIYGKAGVSKFYAKDVFKKVKLTWAPDFTDASESGDMGYTIGKYSWLLKNDKGETLEEMHGIFHTVWKKQTDGSWKFVWD